MSQAILYPVKTLFERKPSHRCCSAFASDAYAKAARRYSFKTGTFEGSQGRVLALKKTVLTMRICGSCDYRDPGSSALAGFRYRVGRPMGFGHLVRFPAPLLGSHLSSSSFENDVLLLSDLKASQPTASGHAVYDPKKSSTAQEVPGCTWKISYGDGSSAGGVVYKDDLKIGDLHCSEQGIEVAQKLSSAFLNGEGSDGLLGLAWPQINTAHPQQKTPMQNMMEKSITNQGLFTVCLKHDTDGKGFYSFGTICAEEAGVSEKDIAYTPIDNKEGDEEIELSENVAIADTGTTLALVSEALTTALYSKIPGAILDRSQGGYVYPADAEVPDIKLAVGKSLAYGPPDKGMVFGGSSLEGTIHLTSDPPLPIPYSKTKHQDALCHCRAGAVVLGATVAEARSVASSPRRHVEKVMKRSNAHETRVEIERLSFTTPSRLSKRSKLANEDWNNTASSPEDKSTPTHGIDPSSHTAPSETHTRATENSAFVDRTVVSNPAEALPNNVIWTIEKKTGQESSKSGASQFTIIPVVPGAKKIKEKKAAPVTSNGGAEYIIIPQADSSTTQNDDSASTTTLLRAIENYREAVAEQKMDSANDSEQPVQNHEFRKTNTESSEFSSPPTDFRTVQTSDDSQA
ncbi:hypothetical protein H4Q26_009210 [Puccinia striiformis f. sp. tritici PST-130]|nr:hypothetical protein H4Q26_009210 [Puccinia striiformis f. sp. tritici PST-130]